MILIKIILKLAITSKTENKQDLERSKDRDTLALKHLDDSNEMSYREVNLSFSEQDEPIETSTSCNTKPASAAQDNSTQSKKKLITKATKISLVDKITEQSNKIIDIRK